MVRLVDGGVVEETDPALRPRRLDEYVGQEPIVRNLRVYVRAALNRGEALDHVLLSGPPGLGKTSLAFVLAEELGVDVRTASGPTLERGGDLAAILTSLKPRQVLFIDEIHRMPRAVEEILYPAMEDFQLDVVIGAGPGAQSVKLDLERFTLVAATTRTGLLTAPLRARFGIQATFEFYSAAEIDRVLARSAEKLGMTVVPAARSELARRARGTPRIANRLLRRVRDFAEVEGDGTVDMALVRSALERLQVDPQGLDRMDHRILEAIGTKFGGGPVGLETLAASLGETGDTIEETYEPYLVQQGLVMRTPRGRVITPRGRAAVGLPPEPGSDDPQETLL
jgi:Holliday junction DNA helicase RuvB